MKITRTPLRISLVGGGTDMPQFYANHVGGVVSFTIDKYVYISTNRKFDGKIRLSYSQTENVETVDELQHDLARECLRLYKVTDSIEVVSVADIPGSGTGLGSSSAYTVGLLNALGQSQHPGILAERAYTVEAESCHKVIGKQDAYSCAYGGLNYIRFHGRSVQVEPLYYNREMQDNFLLLYTGITRSSSDVLKEQGKRFNKGETVEVGRDLSKLALTFKNEFIAGMEMKRMGELVQKGWELKKSLSSVTTPQIDEWMSAALGNGAYGGKLLGAGQGGFLFFIAPYEKHAQIAEATGLRRIDFKIEPFGSEVIYENR